MKEQVAVLVPIYKPELSALEAYSLDVSLALLAGRVIFFIGPRDLRLAFYEQRYPGIPFHAHEPASFASIAGYNRLLLSTVFYERYAATHEFVLILQPDAILLRDDLDMWAAKPYDYIGAPWPEGHSLHVNLGRFEGTHGKRMTVKVGNGGLSLRRSAKCIELLREFEVAANVFTTAGSSEDLFFAFMGALSRDFVIPGEMTASLFSVELAPGEYLHLHGGALPMGGHAWWTWEPSHWLAFLPSSPLLRPLQATSQASIGAQSIAVTA